MCCLFGVIDYAKSLTQRQREKLVYALASAAEVRGKDATGIAYFANERLHIYKRPQPAHTMRFHLPQDAYIIMGHTRMTTQGSERFNGNNHPFLGHTPDGYFALAHNGVLYNDDTLRITEQLPATQIQTDSYVAVQLIEKAEEISFASLGHMAELVMGMFTFTVLDEQQNLYFIKGDNPICIYHYKSLGLYVYASTEAILQAALKRLPFRLSKPSRIDIDCGEILRIDRAGQQTVEPFTFTNIRWNYLWDYPAVQAKNTGTHTAQMRESYLNDLKMVASCYGYTPQYVDYLIEEGFDFDSIEDILFNEQY